VRSVGEGRGGKLGAPVGRGHGQEGRRGAGRRERALRVPPPSDKIGWEGSTACAWHAPDPNAEDPSVNPSDCIFCRIASGEIPATVVYRDEHVVAFRDIDPQAPMHVLVIPVRHIPSLELAADADREILGRILLGARRRRRGSADPPCPCPRPGRPEAGLASGMRPGRAVPALTLPALPGYLRFSPAVHRSQVLRTQRPPPPGISGGRARRGP